MSRALRRHARARQIELAEDLRRRFWMFALAWAMGPGLVGVLMLFPLLKAPPPLDPIVLPLGLAASFVIALAAIVSLRLRSIEWWLLLAWPLVISVAMMASFFGLLETFFAAWEHGAPAELSDTAVVAGGSILACALAIPVMITIAALRYSNDMRRAQRTTRLARA